MTTIYDAAKRSFIAAANLLEALQGSRIELLSETRSVLGGRPRLPLDEGYNSVSTSFGTCLPAGGRAELINSEEEDSSVELRCSNSGWMTLEGNLGDRPIPMEYYVEIGIDAGQPIVADVFIREFAADGTSKDLGHRECLISANSISVCRLQTTELSEDAASHRVIIHLRQPAPRMIIDRLAVTLI